LEAMLRIFTAVAGFTTAAVFAQPAAGFAQQQQQQQPLHSSSSLYTASAGFAQHQQATKHSSNSH
jgi:hypothetical protein